MEGPYPPVEYPGEGMKPGKGEEKSLFLYTDGASRGNPGPRHGRTFSSMETGMSLKSGRQYRQGNDNEADITPYRRAPGCFTNGCTWLSVFSDKRTRHTTDEREIPGCLTASYSSLPEAQSVSEGFAKIGISFRPEDQPGHRKGRPALQSGP